MQSKNAKIGGQRGNSDNSQTRPATQSVPTTGSNPARTSENFYNASGSKTSTGQQQSTSQTAEKSGTPQTPQEKVLITGDDILIEYVERLMTAIRNITEEYLTDQWRIALEKFITHYVWHSQDRRSSTMEGAQPSSNAPYWFRLEGRLTEMQERRRRLIKYLYKKEGRLHEFEEGYKQSIAKKSTIIKKFTSMQLEDLLRTSTKNVA